MNYGGQQRESTRWSGTAEVTQARAGHSNVGSYKHPHKTTVGCRRKRPSRGNREMVRSELNIEMECELLASVDTGTRAGTPVGFRR